VASGWASRGEAVEKALGPGKSTERGVVSYFGGRLQVDYWFHDQLTTRVEALETKWGGFHTRSGVQRSGRADERCAPSTSPAEMGSAVDILFG
jgi:hypothetical protein